MICLLRKDEVLKDKVDGTEIASRVGVVYKACICSVLSYGAETLPMKVGCFGGCEPQREEC